MINARLQSIAKEYSEGRITVFLEGGYSLDIVAKGSQNLLEELSGSTVSSFGDSHTESQNCTEHNIAVMDFLKENLENIFF
jgi:acetoin utilization deacetylase AcuC-like enzyme